MRIFVVLRGLYRIAAASALAITIAANHIGADESIAGTYDARGVDSGGKQHSGVVEIIEIGQTYGMLWRTGSQTIQGIGVATPTSLAVAFSGDGFADAGVVLYERASRDTW